jgi:hypothetical protein
MRHGTATRVAALGLAWTLALPLGAAASTWKGTELAALWNSAAWRLGPFRVQPAFILSEAGYDTNIYYYGLDNPISDYTFTLGPVVRFYVPFHRKVWLAIQESPRYVYYLESRRERSWNNDFRGDLHFNFNRLLISLGRGFSSARQRWNTEIDFRPRLRRDDWQGSALLQPGTKLSMGLDVRRTRLDFENLFVETFSVRDRLNRSETYIDGTAYYQAAPRLRVSAGVELGRFEFENPASGRDARSTRWSGGLEWAGPGVIQGRVRWGWKSFRTLDENRADFHGLAGDADLRFVLSPIVTLRGMVRRDVQFSLWYDNAYFVENRFGAGAAILMTRNTRFEYDYQLGVNSYEAGGAAGGAPAAGSAKRQDDIGLHTFGLSFRLSPRTWFGLSVSLWSRDSNLDWEDDRRNFWGINLRHDF